MNAVIDMANDGSVSNNQISRRNFLLTLGAGGALVAVPDGRVLAGAPARTWPEYV